MAKFQVGKGISQYLSNLDNLHNATPAIIGKAIFDGAGVMADAVRAEVLALPTDNRIIDKDSGDKLKGIAFIQKKGLIDGLGISKAQTDGDYRNVKIGFDGYNDMKTKTYPNGQPNQLIANSVEHGTYFRQKNPFVSRAIRRFREKSEMAMAKKVDEEVAKLFKE